MGGGLVDSIRYLIKIVKAVRKILIGGIEVPCYVLYRNLVLKVFLPPRSTSILDLCSFYKFFLAKGKLIEDNLGTIFKPPFLRFFFPFPFFWGHKEHSGLVRQTKCFLGPHY